MDDTIKLKQVLGMFLGLLAMGLAWYWFGWKLPLILLIQTSLIKKVLITKK